MASGDGGKRKDAYIWQEDGASETRQTRKRTSQSQRLQQKLGSGVGMTISTAPRATRMRSPFIDVEVAGGVPRDMVQRMMTNAFILYNRSLLLELP